MSCVFFACIASKGGTAGGHRLQANQSKRLPAGVGRNPIGRAVQHAQRPRDLAATQTSAILATAIAATAIGTLAGVAAQCFRSLSTIWVGAASLPLLPGMPLLRGLTAPSVDEGVAFLAEALATGFAIGVGVVVGDVLVSTLMRINREVVRPAISRRNRTAGRGQVGPTFCAPEFRHRQESCRHQLSGWQRRRPSDAVPRGVGETEWILNSAHSGLTTSLSEHDLDSRENMRKS